MKIIYFENGVLFYYGNPAGYLHGGTVFLTGQSWSVISGKRKGQKSKSGKVCMTVFQRGLLKQQRRRIWKKKGCVFTSWGGKARS